MNETKRVWLTADAYDRVSSEYEALCRQRDEADAPDDGERLVDGRHLRARIRQLEDLLHNAVVGETPPDDGVAEPGMVLTVRLDDDPEPETFLLGVRDGGKADELEVYSPDSPLGRALTGARQGEERSYVVPSGATVRVTLVRAVPYGSHQSAG
ncbi:transcription elongation factor GreAB [Prauserella marina]|uniref:Transcription elongation factor GreA n=2 Tax=Prauserella marina TaxID=530584 RepID=A0A222VKM8_9PSEU|nr:GreA/GreB family elongation factor [Prauserella marina]ASR34489.1 transcription elongation factor GreAB [Prauserella marina]PWV85913.1 GreA/GreB family elongation factor [Prauserella marina]SDC42464.1 transcription elongation factor GreA [Prauserella marina]